MRLHRLLCLSITSWQLPIFRASGFEKPPSLYSRLLCARCNGLPRSSPLDSSCTYLLISKVNHFLLPHKEGGGQRVGDVHILGVGVFFFFFFFFLISKFDLVFFIYILHFLGS